MPLLGRLTTILERTLKSKQNNSKLVPDLSVVRKGLCLPAAGNKPQAEHACPLKGLQMIFQGPEAMRSACVETTQDASWTSRIHRVGGSCHAIAAAMSMHGYHTGPAACYATFLGQDSAIAWWDPLRDVVEM